jgi:branched-chain amino acid transport system substrate-binding protein
MAQVTRRDSLRVIGATALSLSGGFSRAAELKPIRIGVLGDQSGMSADAAGPGTVAAVRMAVEDFGGKVGNLPVEVIVGDMRLKPDVAAQLAAQWYDVDGVDVIIDLPQTSSALAVLEVAKQRGKSTIVTAAASLELTTSACSATNVHWTDDTYALANAVARAVVKSGGDSWFFLTADYAFGTAIQRDATAAITEAGGSVLGSVRHPLGTSDFASYLLQAQASKAKIVGLGSVGGDTITAIKQADEFGLGSGGQQLAGFLVFISDIHSLGLPAAHGLYVATGFYWDQNDAARVFAKRFFERRKAMPTKSQAASYAAIQHYLKCVSAAGSTDARTVNREMRQRPGDYFGHKAVIRGDGRVLYDMTLYQVKTPAESHGPWDYYKKIKTISASEAFLPEPAGRCVLKG